MADVRDDRKYQKSHEWAKLEGDIATVGISDFAQDSLGDVVYFDLPEVGTSVTKGESFAEIESVKAVSDVYAPFDGEIVEANEELDGTPELVNSDPYGAGWMVKIRLTNVADFDALMNSQDYQSTSEG